MKSNIVYDKGYPGHYELMLNRDSGECTEEFVPDDLYIYVDGGAIRDKPGAVLIYAINPNNSHCVGIYCGYKSGGKRQYPFWEIYTIYPYMKQCERMHDKLWQKRNISCERVVTQSYYQQRYGSFICY